VGRIIKIIINIIKIRIYCILKNKFLENFSYMDVKIIDIISEYKINKSKIDLIVVFIKDNVEFPSVIIEVKVIKININLGSKNKILKQAKNYTELIKTPYIIITDGENILCYKVRGSNLDDDVLNNDKGS